MDYKSMTFEQIVAWCKANNQVAWLKEIGKQTTTDEDGKVHRISFIEIKVAFVNKFMPEIAPKKKETKPSMYDILDSL
jgi:hypothetical protein